MLLSAISAQPDSDDISPYRLLLGAEEVCPEVQSGGRPCYFLRYGPRVRLPVTFMVFKLNVRGKNINKHPLAKNKGPGK